MDCFALLDEPRRPGLDAEALKQKFLALSAAVHPDRTHTAPPEQRAAAHRRYTDLNAAYTRLRDPKQRLQHLIELELGAAPSNLQEIPPDLMDLFLRVGRVCREVDAFLAHKASVTSPLLRVQLFDAEQNCLEKLEALQQTLKRWQDELLGALQQLDADWDSGDRAAVLRRAEELYRLFAYGARWSSQLQERRVQLAL